MTAAHLGVGGGRVASEAQVRGGRAWFSAERQITGLVAVDTNSIGPLERVGYRFTGDRPDGHFAIEQQAYYRIDGETIAWLRIMCSGFLPSGGPASSG